MMKYFKDEKNNVYAYAADGSEDDFIQPELIAISEVEAMAIVKPLPDIEDARSQKHAEINR
ncbi:tail fiber assembly protein, partial [Salmonella enterica]